MQILVADDEGPKLDSVVNVVGSVFPEASVKTAMSVRAALALLRHGDVSLMVLDMSLPTFDVAQGEQGGRPQNYGGIELLRYMDFYGVVCPVVIVTQYDAFPDKGGHVDLVAIARRLRGEHPATFRDLIHYGGATDEVWRQRLVAVLSAVRECL
jgi:CheY-like chemotaxis protein